MKHICFYKILLYEKSFINKDVKAFFFLLIQFFFAVAIFCIITPTTPLPLMLTHSAYEKGIKLMITDDCLFLLMDRFNEDTDEKKLYFD